MTYRDIDAFETDDGKVMVCLGKPGHLAPEQYVPEAAVKRYVAALEEIANSLGEPGEPAWRRAMEALCWDIESAERAWHE
jgi:hypothetical protein